MRPNLLVKIVTVGVSVGALLAPMVSASAATPIKLSFPSQLPNAVAGKSYTYALSTRVSGGTGKPYTFKLTGALPTGLKMSTKGELYGAIPKTAKNGKYTFKICATGAKKTGSTASWNTACKTSTLTMTGGTAAVVENSPGVIIENSSGTYAGNVTTPPMATCSPSTFERTVTLVETAGGAITGKTNHGFPTTLAGTRVGNAITVTLQMQFGPRGPFVWQWNGNTLTGSLPAFCWDADTLAQLGEGSYNFVLTKR